MLAFSFIIVNLYFQLKGKALLKYLPRFHGESFAAGICEPFVILMCQSHFKEFFIPFSFQNFDINIVYNLVENV